MITLRHILPALGAAALISTGLAGAVQASPITTDDYVLVTENFIGAGGNEVVYNPDRKAFPGNDCAGALGTPPQCSWNGSPMIAKFDFNDDGTITFTQGVFDTITADNWMSKFSFNIAYDPAEEEWAGTGSWTYTPGPNDPGITAFSVKGGPWFSVYEKEGTAWLGIGDTATGWFAPMRTSTSPYGVSHIVFFDSVVPIPLPAAGWLLITAIGGMALMRRRRELA